MAAATTKEERAAEEAERASVEARIVSDGPLPSRVDLSPKSWSTFLAELEIPR